MRNTLVPVALAVMLGSSGLALAAGTAPAMPAPAAAATLAAPQSITDTVKAVDMTAHTLTLANGISYKLPATFKDPGLKVGEKVTVKWQMNGTNYNAQSVTIG